MSISYKHRAWTFLSVLIFIGGSNVEFQKWEWKYCPMVLRLGKGKIGIYISHGLRCLSLRNTSGIYCGKEMQFDWFVRKLQYFAFDFLQAFASFAFLFFLFFFSFLYGCSKCHPCSSGPTYKRQGGPLRLRVKPMRIWCVRHLGKIK